MHSYSIYTGISHVNQLTKLRPSLIKKIRVELDTLARRYGGRRVDSELYIFPPSLGETARKAAEAASAMYRLMMDTERELLGVTVLVAGGGDGGENNLETLQSVLLKVPEDDGFWVSIEVLKDFLPYLEGRERDGLFRVSGLKEAGLRLEERLPRLLIRNDMIPPLTGAIERLDRSPGEKMILRVAGPVGSGKRATLTEALRRLFPDDGGSPLVIPFAADAEDPMEPFARAPGSFIASVAEYLDEDEKTWWENEGFDFLDSCRNGRIWDTSRDQGPVDLIQAFALYVKAHVERRRRSGRPAYLIVDGFNPESEAVAWLRSLVSEFMGRDSFRLIIIRDGVQEESLPLTGKVVNLKFTRPAEEYWMEMVKESASRGLPSEQQLEVLSAESGADLYRLFHGLLAVEKGFDIARAGEQLVSSLDGETRRMLFLAHAASGLADRRLVTERLGTDEEEATRQGALYDGLVDYGLIREDSDGKVRGIPEGPENAFSPDLENIRAAEQFGEYLYRRYRDGDTIDLYRLFRYLESWGPTRRAVEILDRLLESLLDNRRLRAVGLLLNGPPMALSDLDGPDLEALQNVVGAARLRYVLLTGDTEQVKTMVREGTVTLISGRGAYSDRFRLHQARFSYAVGRWDDTLAASKEALFNFQKAGDHEGETSCHLELALALLAGGKVRDALEHFGISRRIGSQVSASWGVLRAAAMEVVGQFLFGNLPRSSRDCDELRRTAHKNGRRDLWLLLTLCKVRIYWELGRYDEAAVNAEEGRRTARFYGLNDEAAVMRLWKGRARLAQGREEGRDILEGAPENREARAFLAEAAWQAGEGRTARRHISAAMELTRRSTRVQGEAEDWSDGFFPIEGRLADSSGPLDVLGEWIRAFDAFLGAEDGDAAAMERLEGSLERDGRRIPGPYSYQYALWALLTAGGDERETRTRFMSRAFNDLQARAGRFDDNQTKHAWLSANPWNKRIMDEAQRLKFLGDASGRCVNHSFRRGFSSVSVDINRRLAIHWRSVSVA